jgi:hypothetical protein
MALSNKPIIARITARVMMVLRKAADTTYFYRIIRNHLARLLRRLMFIKLSRIKAGNI